MSNTIKELYAKAEGRYLSDLEGAQLAQYADTMLASLESAQSVERAEEAILNQVVKRVMDGSPGISKDHGPMAEQLIRRDQALVLRYAVMGMIVNDENFVHDKLAVWLRTIMLAQCNPKQVMLGYRYLIDACNQQLLPQDAARVVPFIQVVLREFEAHTKGQPS
jgi:hypothetical protein